MELPTPSRSDARSSDQVIVADIRFMDIEGFTPVGRGAHLHVVQFVTGVSPIIQQTVYSQAKRCPENRRYRDPF
jgi:hypothetical protein